MEDTGNLEGKERWRGTASHHTWGSGRGDADHGRGKGRYKGVDGGSTVEHGVNSPRKVQTGYLVISENVLCNDVPLTLLRI